MLRRSRAALLALGLYLVLSASFLQLLAHPATRAQQGGSGDPGLFLFFLANTSHALWHAQGSGLLVTHLLGVPDGVNVLWNTSLLLPGLVLSPLTELAGPVVTLNVVSVLGPALSAWSAFLCSGRFLRSTTARLATGLAFGFGPAVTAAADGHLHLTLLFLVPPMLLVTVQLATGERPWRRGGPLLGLLAGAQALVGEEVLALTAVAAVVVLLVLAAQRPRQALPGVRRLAVAGASAVLPFLLLAGYPLLQQFAGPYRVHGELQLHDRYKVDPVQLLTPGPHLMLRTPASATLVQRDLMNSSELMGYLGVPLLLVVLFLVLARRRDVVTRTAAASAVVLVVLALGSTLRLDGDATGWHLPWAAFDRLPLLTNLLPVRFMLLVDLLLALLLGLAVQQAALWRRWAGFAVAVVALVPFLPTPERAEPVDVPRFFADGAPGVTGTALVVPLAYPPYAAPMVWQSVAGLPFAMPGGYYVGPDAKGRAGFGPSRPSAVRRVLERIGTTGQGQALTEAERAALLGELHRDGVTTVVLAPAYGSDAYRAFLAALLGAEPVRRDDVDVWWHVP